MIVLFVFLDFFDAPLISQYGGNTNNSVTVILLLLGGSVTEWLACWTQAQMGLGSFRSRDAVE